MSLTEDDKQWIAAQLKQFATKADLEPFATKLDLERIETNLLTEFHKWASPLEARIRTHSAALRALDLEMEQVTDRVEKLEGHGPQA